MPSLIERGIAALNEIHSGETGLSNVRVLSSLVTVVLLAIHVMNNFRAPAGMAVPMPWTDAATIAAVLGLKVLQKPKEGVRNEPVP